MTKWYRETAPVRQKLFVMVCIMTGLVVVAALAGSLATWLGGIVTGLTAGIAITVTAAFVGAWFRAAIADPYVTTVERMEGLASGDLSSPILFTDYQDCVGRLTKAMFTFRDAAVALNAGAAEQRLVVDTLSTHLERLSAGDLMAVIESDLPHEYAALKTNFMMRSTACADLSRPSLIALRRSGPDPVRIAQAAEDLARRTESNAANLEEVAEAITRMDGRLKATATAATVTVGRADQAIETVGSGRAVAADAVQSMGRVSATAEGIDNVIEGLDKIAFQTRVLAMNAAVEAGRAGEAGRGLPSWRIWFRHWRCARRKRRNGPVTNYRLRKAKS